MIKKVTVVFIRSLSYTGTTWLNIVMGCHESAMALGPADRIWNILGEGKQENICRVHGADCDFWPRFSREYSPDENFFVALARFTGKSHFITNNLVPGGAMARQLQHPDIETRYVQVVRDGRALAASYRRKFPDQTFLDAICGFLQPSFQNFLFDEANPDLLCLRYEEVVARQTEALARISKFLGLDYGIDALRFWQWRHHLVVGNQGAVTLLRLGEGLPIANFEGRDFYEKQFARINSGDPYSFRDDRSDNALTRFEKFLFDCFAGDDNARYGYERDSFTVAEFKEFSAHLRKLAASDAIPSPLLDRVDFLARIPA